MWFLPFLPNLSINFWLETNFSIAFANEFESLGFTRKPLNLSKQTSLQPGTLVEIIGNSQLAASKRLLGRPSRYDGKIAILDSCK